jgi:hypothetical protein
MILFSWNVLNTYTWTNMAAGTYSLTAKAYDNLGAVTTSTAVSIVVKTNNTLPTVSLTSPANNASFDAGVTIAINANAADVDGTIVRVDFYDGTLLLNSDNAAPYSYSWSNVQAGIYNLTAKATDNSGGVTTSTVVQIVVNTVVASDLIGPTCATRKTSSVYQLSAANTVNMTTTAWWLGGSGTATPVAGQPSKATIYFDPWFTGGNVCVGVNYSVSPWYKSFCKTVSVCPTKLSNSTTLQASLVMPIPSSNTFQLVAAHPVQNAKVFDQLGKEQLNLSAMDSQQSIYFGELLPSGVYFLKVEYEDKTNEVIKLIKSN